MSELDLRRLARNISDNTLVLPNFQREYVWGDNSRQVGYLASILARIPLGNIIIFRDDKDKFACRKIGKKINLKSEDIQEDKVSFLLDGQQRLTTLLMIFSDRLYKDSVNDSKVSFKDLLKGLKNRFFIKVPSYNTKLTELSDDDDIFGYLKLKFPFYDIPSFCSSDIFDGEQSEIIKVKSFTTTGDEWFNPKKNPNPECSDIVYEAVLESLIPCYLLLDESAVLGDLLKKLAERRSDYLYSAYNSATGSIADGKRELCKALSIGKDSSKYTDEDLKRDLNNRAIRWAEDMKSYLFDCITRLKINCFEVTDEGTERAIDIYEALNKGGVELSTYDLIIARAAKEDTAGESLNEKLEGIVTAYCNPKLLNSLKPGLASWSSVDKLDTIKKGSIDKVVVKQFLNLLCITSKCEIGKMRGSISTKHCKEKEQLNLTPREINGGAGICMESIVDALMYLNIKQGVYKLSCIHYELTLLPLAYAFYVAKRKNISFDQANNEGKFFLNMLNAWYKTAVFTDFYQMSQSTRVLDHICDIDDMLLNKTLPAYFKEGFEDRLKMVLNVPHYNNFKMLIYNDPGYTLSRGIEKYIIQYYLSYKDMGALDILKDDNNNEQRIFAYSDRKLAVHHFIPLYVNKRLDTKVPKNTDDMRDSAELFNSPLNKVIVSSKANQNIGPMMPSAYQNAIPSNYFTINDFDKIDYLKSDSIVSEDLYRHAYEYRYEHMKDRIRADITESVEIMKSVLKNTQG